MIDAILFWIAKAIAEFIVWIVIAVVFLAVVWIADRRKP